MIIPQGTGHDACRQALSQAETERDALKVAVHDMRAVVLAETFGETDVLADRDRIDAIARTALG